MSQHIALQGATLAPLEQAAKLIEQQLGTGYGPSVEDLAHIVLSTLDAHTLADTLCRAVGLPLKDTVTTNVEYEPPLDTDTMPLRGFEPAPR